MKYVVVEVAPFLEAAVVFPDVIEHKNAVSLDALVHVRGAGFCGVSQGQVGCWGESNSLGVKSRKGLDEDAVRISLVAMGVLV